MTKHFRDDSGRRWKAWLFVCFSDPAQPQRRIRMPAGSFESLSTEDLVSRFTVAEPDPAIR